MQPHTSYIICATPRSGSFLLCEALKNTDLAGQPNEYFGLGQEEFFMKRWGASNYADYFPKVIEAGTTPNGVFGAKVLWLYFDDFVNKLRQIPGYSEMEVPSLLSTIFPNLHYIWITRRDKVRQAVSYWKALQTNVWTQFTDEPVSLIKEPVFDFEEIEHLLQQIVRDETAWKQYFDVNGIQPFIVVYEELVSGYEETGLQILEYLNISHPEELVFKRRYLQRQADTLSEEWVQRYHNLKQTQKDAEHI